MRCQCRRVASSTRYTRLSSAGIPPCICMSGRLVEVDRFYLADASRDRKTGGAGLVLSIALEIDRAPEGTIVVESAKGRRATFVTSLPSHRWILL